LSTAEKPPFANLQNTANLTDYDSNKETVGVSSEIQEALYRFPREKQVKIAPCHFCHLLAFIA
jgi:hypothetical protein